MVQKSGTKTVSYTVMLVLQLSMQAVPKNGGLMDNDTVMLALQ